MTASAFCPKCGNQRVGSFRYCRSCGFDFEAGAAAAPAAVSSTVGLATTAAPSRSGGLAGKLIVVAIVIALAIGGLIVWSNIQTAAILSSVGDALGTPSPTVIDTVNTPPIGDIWFGETFDTDTFELSGRTSSVGANEPFAIVAQLPEIVDGDSLNLRLSFEREVIATNAFGAEGSGDLWGWSASPLITPGEWTYEMTDIGGNVLAAGTVHVTE